MKKYLLNKNFIPESFVKNKERDIYKRNKRSTLLMAILVIAFIPETMKFIFYDRDDNKIDKEVSYYGNLSDESFYKWMDIINSDTVGTFNNSNAEIYVCGMDKFQQILNDEKIVVTNVEDLGDKKFKIQINVC